MELKKKIHIYTNDALVKALDLNEIAPEDYGPAYDGESVGLDLYYAGEDVLYITEENSKMIIPTGLHIALPLGYVALVKDRGSITKTKVVRRAGVVDPGYTGEIFVNLFGNITINPGDKLPAQIVVVKAETNFELASKEQFDKLTQGSKRCKGKVGSSN